jgi:hypothetical protein
VNQDRNSLELVWRLSVLVYPFDGFLFLDQAQRLAEVPSQDPEFAPFGLNLGISILLAAVIFFLTSQELYELHSLKSLRVTFESGSHPFIFLLPSNRLSENGGIAFGSVQFERSEAFWKMGLGD